MAYNTDHLAFGLPVEIAMFSTIQNLLLSVNWTPSWPEQECYQKQIIVAHAKSKTFGVLLALSALLPSARAQPFVVNNSLQINQGQTVQFSGDQLAMMGVNPSAQFTMSNVTHGFFSNTSFLQQPEFMPSFTHDGGLFAPSYSVLVVDGPNQYGPFYPNISFNKSPVMGNNSLTLYNGQLKTLSFNDLSATDPDDLASSLIFMVTDLRRGQFFLNNNTKNAVSQFSQSQVMNGEVQFRQDGTNIAPYYVVTAQDPHSASSAPSVSVIDFIAYGSATPIPLPVQPSHSSIVRRAIIGSSISGAFGLSLFILRLFLMGELARRFEKEMEAKSATSDQEQSNYWKNVVRPIAKELFQYIKVTGFWGYISEKSMKAYIQAVVVLLTKLQAQGVAVDLHLLPVEQKHSILNDIVSQTHKTVRSKKRACFWLSSFFMADVTPKKLEEHADLIAKKVKAELDHTQSQVKITML